MTQPVCFTKKITDTISSFWRIATAKNNLYEYVIENIELQNKNNRLCSIIYYRAIGSRTMEYRTASELNCSDIFSKFMPIQAQSIVTLATIESMLTMDLEKLKINYMEYAKKCAKIFQSQRRK